MRYADATRFMNIMRYYIVLMASGYLRNKQYLAYMVKYLARMDALEEKERCILLSNLTINVNGGKGDAIAVDLFQEHINMEIKRHVRTSQPTEKVCLISHV